MPQSVLCFAVAKALVNSSCILVVSSVIFDCLSRLYLIVSIEHSSAAVGMQDVYVVYCPWRRQ